MRHLPSTDRLRELFDYSPETGELIRMTPTSNRGKFGEVAGFVGKNSYLYASVDGKTYPLHRLVWQWHGKAPADFIDHIDRTRSNNRIENLRSATISQNLWNKGIGKNNTTGVKGVIWHKAKRKYRVRLGVNGKRMHIGDFDDLELAELVISEARAKYHGQFASF